MVYVAVALYAPVWYTGSLVRVQVVELPPVPALIECASAPKEATGVAEAVLDVCVPTQAVAGATALQT